MTFKKLKKRNWLLCNPLPNTSTSCNKDLNGGYGTWDKIGNNLISKFIAKSKKNNIKIPVLCLGYIRAILEEKGINCSYSENLTDSKIKIKNDEIEAVVIYGSIVCCDLENKLISQIKELDSRIKIFVVGTYPTKFPDNFKNSDYVIIGEPENFFINWNGNLKDLSSKGKNILSENLKSLDLLPIPIFTKYFSTKFAYSPMLSRPTGFIEATRGCPYSCGYYCTYGENQGKVIRSHSPERLVYIMNDLISKYGFKSFQFRDPVFGLKKGFIEEFCLAIIKSGLECQWGMETRIDLLDESKLRLMKKAGLKSINIGIETPNIEVAAANKRKICPDDHQKKIIEFAFNNNIRINAFYIMGLEEDNLDTCNETIDYSLSLKTYMARYSVCTPYPGTGYYDDLNKENRLNTKDLSSFNQQELVYKHKNLDSDMVKKLIQKAYIKYYFRPKVIWNILKEKIKR